MDVEKKEFPVTKKKNPMNHSSILLPFLIIYIFIELLKYSLKNRKKITNVSN